MKILAIVPARGGSKGILHKNIRNLAGKPMISYTISAAKKSKYIDRIIVTTDDKKIAKVSSSAGAEVPFLRPQKISKDNSTTLQAVKHTLDFLRIHQSYVPDVIVILQPTSPLRTTKLIDDTINTLIKSKATCALTVSKIKKHPFSSFWLKSGFLEPFTKNFMKYVRRQKQPDLYFPTGDVYALWYRTIEKYGSIYGPKIKPVLAESIGVDIDDPFDLFLAEMIIKHWDKYKKSF